MAGMSWAACVLLALCACWPLLVAAQVESPLKGQGKPGEETTKVFLSVRLERLLDGNGVSLRNHNELCRQRQPRIVLSKQAAPPLPGFLFAVDDYNFKHENVATYWLSWLDSGAEDAITERTSSLEQVPRTRSLAEGPAPCRRPCSNRVADDRCCDTIFLPSLYFANVASFPGDRATGYSIDTTANGAVVWETTVHAVFYQPLSLRNYPHEDYSLETKIILTDTSRHVERHPGLELVPSGVSVEGLHFARNPGDLTNGFNAVSRAQAGLQLYRFNRSAWYQGRMMVPPHASDVAPFTALNTSTAGLLDDTVQMAVFRYKVWRSFWSAHLNTILPIFAVAFLCQLVFWIPEDELIARIELCVSLFLTLIAILFVVGDRAVTRNDHLTQPQALILVTGSYIVAVALESVLCYYIFNWKNYAKKRKAMRKAWKKETTVVWPEECWQRQCCEALVIMITFILFSWWWTLGLAIWRFLFWSSGWKPEKRENRDWKKIKLLHETLRTKHDSALQFIVQPSRWCMGGQASGQGGATWQAGTSRQQIRQILQTMKTKLGCALQRIRESFLWIMGCQNEPVRVHSKKYYAFIARRVNYVAMVLGFICYVISAMLNALLRDVGFRYRAPDALLSFSELSSCQVPGVLPGVAGPCPAAPLGVGEL